MIVGDTIKRAGEWTTAADTITLDESARHRRRMAMVSDDGIAFLLDLPEALLLFSGDLAARIAWGERLFANAAPLGGTLLIAGWLSVGAAGIGLAIRRPTS